jgi:hypothetical protein
MFRRNPQTGTIEIIKTGDPVVDNLGNRAQSLIDQIKQLAYDRLKLTRQVEEIDKVLDKLEGAQFANDLVQKDIDLRETIAKAQKEAAEKRAAEEAAKKPETSS